MEIYSRHQGDFKRCLSVYARESPGAFWISHGWTSALPHWPSGYLLHHLHMIQNATACMFFNQTQRVRVTSLLFHSTGFLDTLFSNGGMLNEAIALKVAMLSQTVSALQLLLQGSSGYCPCLASMHVLSLVGSQQRNCIKLYHFNLCTKNFQERLKLFCGYAVCGLDLLWHDKSRTQ